jgi:hypothetical protein
MNVDKPNERLKMKDILYFMLNLIKAKNFYLNFSKPEIRLNN